MAFLKCLSVAVLLLWASVSDSFEFYVASQFNQSVPQEVQSLMDFFQNFKAYLGVPPGDFQQHTITLYLYKGNHKVRRDLLDADLYTLNFKLYIRPYECTQMQLPRFYLCYSEIFDSVDDYPVIEFQYDVNNAVSPFSTFIFNFADHLLLERVHLQPRYNTLPSNLSLTLGSNFTQDCEALKGARNMASLQCEYQLCKRFPNNRDFVSPLFSPKNAASSLTINTTSVRDFNFPIRAVIEAWNTFDIIILSSNFTSINTCDALFTIIQSEKDERVSVTSKTLTISSSEFNQINTEEPSLNSDIHLVQIPYSSSLLYTYNSRLDVQITNSKFLSVLNSKKVVTDGQWKNHKAGAILLQFSKSFYLLDTMKFSISSSLFQDNQNMNGGMINLDFTSQAHNIKTAQIQFEVQYSTFERNSISQFLIKSSTLQQKSKINFSHNQILESTLESSLTSLIQFIGDVNPQLTNFYSVIPSPQDFTIFQEGRLHNLDNMISISNNTFVSNQGNSGTIINIQSGSTVHLEGNSFSHQRLAAPGACNPVISVGGLNYLKPPIILADNNTFNKIQLSNPIASCGLLYSLQFAGFQTILHNDYIQGLSSLSNLESLNIQGSLIYAFEANSLIQGSSTLKIQGMNFRANVQGSFGLIKSASSLRLQSSTFSSSLMKGRGTLIEASDSLTIYDLNIANLILRGKLTLIAGAKQSYIISFLKINTLSIQDGSIVNSQSSREVSLAIFQIHDLQASIGDSSSLFVFESVGSLKINDFVFEGSKLRSRNTYEISALFYIFNSTSIQISSLLLKSNNFDLCGGFSLDQMTDLEQELFEIEIENNQATLSNSGFISIIESKINLNSILLRENQGVGIKIISSQLYLPILEASNCRLNSQPLLSVASSTQLTVGRLSLSTASSNSNLLYISHKSVFNIDKLQTSGLNVPNNSVFKLENESKLSIYEALVDLKQSVFSSLLHSVTQSQALLLKTEIRGDQSQVDQTTIQSAFLAQDYSKISLTDSKITGSLGISILFETHSYSILTINKLNAGQASLGLSAIDSILKSINHGVITINDSNFYNVRTHSKSLIRGHSSSQLFFTNTNFNNFQTSVSPNDFLILTDSTLSLSNSVFNQFKWRSSSLLSASSSTINIKQTTISSAQSSVLFSAQESTILVSNSKFQASLNESQEQSRRGFVFRNIGELMITESEFQGFIHHSGSGAAFSLTQIQQANVVIRESNFLRSKAARGAAIYSKGANISIQYSYFVENEAGEVKKEDRIEPLNGGAIYFECSQSKYQNYFLDSNQDCELTLSKTTFARNKAEYGGGGAVYWDLPSQPSTQQCTFLQNSASFGDNLASRAFNLNLIDIVKKRESTSSLLHQQIRMLSNTVVSSISQTSGERFNQNIALSVQDFYGNILRNLNSLVVEVRLEEVDQKSFTHSMNGITYISCKNGIFNLTDLSVTSLPGSKVYLLIASQFSQQPLRIEVPIRECRPGEKYTADNRCERCPDGSFSFRAMSEPGECKICPDNASCAVQTGIQPHSGHWLLDQNTYPLTVIECPNQEACLGKMQCAKEYEGRLCAQCSKAGNGSQLGLYYCPSCQNLLITVLSSICAIGLAIFLIIITLRALFLNFLNPWEEKSNVIMAARILFTHFHLLVFLFNIDLDWPYWLRTTFYIISGPVTNEATSFLLNCALNSFPGFNQSDMLFFRLLTVLLYPFGLFILVSILGFLIYCCVIIRNRSIRRRDRDQLVEINNLEYGSYQERSSIQDDGGLEEGLLSIKAMLFAFFCVTYFICYPYLVLQCIQVFSCSQIGTHSYMTLNLNTLCWSSEHLSYFVTLGLLGLLTYVIAIPLILILCMRSRLHSYQKDLVLRFMFGVFTAGYPDVKYYLYGLIFIRNLILAIISGLFMKDVPSYVAVILILILSGILLITWKLQTYETAFGQQLSSGSVLISLITLYLSFTYLFTSSQDPTHHHSITVSVIILIIQGFFIILLIILTLWGFQVDKSQFLSVLGRLLILGYPITEEKHSVVDTAPVRSSIMQKSYNEQYEYEQTASFMNFLREEPEHQRKMKQQLKKSRFEFLKSMSRRQGEQLVQSGSSRNLELINSSSHHSIFHSTFSESDRQF